TLKGGAHINPPRHFASDFFKGTANAGAGRGGDTLCKEEYGVDGGRFEDPDALYRAGDKSGAKSGARRPVLAS
ncbi:hypothetical protein KBI52_01640, partial [Microvirga sp. HBU67558]|uniref:hypothetical protein n=1 Tax=Microvirga sp. HBU67558 TaxID=2824562 RepID=UPI001B38F056